jgi:hypothetical protein
MYLYRGVSRRSHIAGDGLKTKASGAFEYAVRWGEPMAQWDSGVTWDMSEANAVIRHQWNQEGLPTSGISTTPHLHRAMIYACGKDGRQDGVVYRIERSTLLFHQVGEFVVSKYSPWPSVPEDEEVILVPRHGNVLPPELVLEVISVLPR